MIGLGLIGTFPFCVSLKEPPRFQPRTSASNMSSREQEDSKLAADAERELTRLWRAWRTVHEMCQDRVCAG